MISRRGIASLIAALATLSALSRACLAASAADLAGTYTLVSAKNFGESAKGSMMMDSKGRFSIILMRNDLPKFASNKRVEGTADEYKATVSGSLAYFGSYSVSGTELVFKVEQSTFANWNGTEQKRIDVTVSGSELRYTNPSPSAGGAPDQVVWKRAN